MLKTPKKLIEVALPLDDINAAAAREKSIRHGHPSTLHLWWARRPLAAARAVLFAQIVNDPGYQHGGGFKFGVNKEHAAIEREKLFDLMRELVKWENLKDENVLAKAQDVIEKSWRETCEINKGHPNAEELFNSNMLPAFHDPFAGGGALPLEAQRLGLESFASDLNPIAVLINKAALEIPPRFRGQEPIGPIPDSDKQGDLHDDWGDANGISEDVRRYGYWMCVQAEKRIGNCYPHPRVTKELAAERPELQPYVGKDLEVVAWHWARTVKSPNPAFSNVHVPLVSTFVLSAKKGKEAYVQPEIEDDSYRFEIRVGRSADFDDLKKGTKLSRGANFRCILSDSPIEPKYIKAEAQEGRMGTRLMAIAVQYGRKKFYLSPTDQDELIPTQCVPSWRPEVNISGTSQYLGVKAYGMERFSQLFTERQLTALATFSDLVADAREKITEDARAKGFVDDARSFEDGGSGPVAYAEAVSTYLAFAVDYGANYWSTLATPAEGFIRGTFSMQALQMSWDFAEAPPFGSTSGNWKAGIDWVVKAIRSLPATIPGHASQQDAARQRISSMKLVSTDPPYYDNVPYSDLSDYFYVWLRRSMRDVYPELFATVATPKTEELVAFAYRHDSKEAAAEFFLDGMTQSMHRLAETCHPGFPVSIYYAFKQSETKEHGTGSTGWEAFLDSVIRAGFMITGTWPMRTERGSRSRSIGSNALASSIVLVCRKRLDTGQSTSRRQFQRQLRDEMPDALDAMIGGSVGASPVAPVDLAQASIGPGMAIYSRYEAVLNQDGTKMTVHDALILINRSITEFLNPDTGNFDNDTLFCDSWFAEYGWSTGEFGQANVLAQAKGTTVDGVRDAGVIESGGSKVRLLRWNDYPADWDPRLDNRTPVWEALHHMIRTLNSDGESAAGSLLARMPERGESIRQLAYHLYTLCERKKWAEDARAYNELIISWHAIVGASHDMGHTGTQVQLDLEA